MSYVRLSACMLIYHKGHTDTIQVYSVTVMTHVKALQAGHSSQGTSEPITPGRLVDYRRQFERTTRTVGEDPAIFATALETLAVKAFGDMGQTAQLRLIRDRFIAGHSNCDLRRHLDSVLLETLIRDVVDRCRVWKSHSDPVY